MTNSDVQAIQTSFIKPKLSIIGTATARPTWATLQLAQRECNQNAASLTNPSNDFGYLHLTLSPAKYLAYTGTAHVPLVNPGLTPPHLAGATAAQLAETNRQFKVDSRLWREERMVDQAMVNQLLTATHDKWTRDLSNDVVGYGRCTTLIIFTHLWPNYGDLSARMYAVNIATMKGPWRPPSPFEDLIIQLDTARDFANHGTVPRPISDLDYVDIGYKLIEDSTCFPEACRAWRLKPEVDKTIVNFKAHFSVAVKDRSENETTILAGYHSPPQEQANAATTGTPPAPTILPPPATEQQETQTGCTYYCWTHGLGQNRFHTSATCRFPDPGHQDTATATNKMGGSVRVHEPNARGGRGGGRGRNHGGRGGRGGRGEEE